MHGLGPERRLLARRAHVGGGLGRMAGAPGVDVEPAAARVARGHAQLGGPAALPDVHEHALDAVLVKVVVIAKADDVAQQPGLVDLRAGVADLHAAPVGLAGDGAIAFQQAAGQCFFHRLLVEGGRQQIGRRAGHGLAFDVEAIEVEAVQLVHRLAVEVFRRDEAHADRGLHRPALPDGGAHIDLDAAPHLGGVSDARAVEAAQVKLEGFAFDDVRALARHHDVGDGQLRLAAQVEPRQLEGRPQVGAKKARLAGDADAFTLWRARNGKQQQ